MKLKMGTSGRVSALVAVAVVLIMLAVPFTALNFNTEYTSASPLVHVGYDANGGDAGGGTYLPPATTFERGLGSSEVKFDPIPERSGYVFIGWNTAANGTGTWYRMTDPYEERFYDEDSDATFYAQWQEIPSASKFSLNADRTLDREITWDASLGVYKYRLGTGAWQNLEDNIIQFSGGLTTNGHNGQIVFSLTGGIPFPDDYRLYVVFDSISIVDLRATSAANVKVDIVPGAKVILQLVGNSTIDHHGGTFSSNATIRVVDNGAMSSDFIVTGQSAGKLTISKARMVAATVDPSIGAVIGGNGSSSGSRNAETAGHIQIESGILDLKYSATRTRGATIGGGGTTDVASNAGDGGVFEMHGGSIITYQESTGAAFYSPAIGGGGGATINANRAGHGGEITITGGSIDIYQECTSNTYGVRAAAIGGGASYSTKAGDSGTINISGGNIKITQQGGAVAGAGIGAASPQTSSTGSRAGQAIGINETGGQNYIAISGGNIEIKQTNTSTANGTLRGAGIGGGAGSTAGVEGAGADVRISGGYISIERTSTARISNEQGAAIGGGAEESRPSEVVISGGIIDIKIAINDSRVSANLAGAAIGCNLNPDPASFVHITGGIVNISRVLAGVEMTVPVGPNGDFGKAPIIDGGSIRLTGDLAFDTAGPNAPTDSQGHPLYRAKVMLVPTDNPQSLFVKKATFIDEEFGTERYTNFHVQGRHKNLQGPGDYDYLNLYLPQTGEHQISLEISSDGTVKTFATEFNVSGNVAWETNTTLTMYRVVYRIGSRMRYEDDIVHFTNTGEFANSIRATNDAVNDVVAPWDGPDYVERHNIDYNNDLIGKVVVSLDNQYDYFASETPLVKAPNNVINPDVLTSYGNIEFNTTISGRLVITMEEVNRVNVTYIDDYTHTLDPSRPAARQIDRVFGEGYPAILVGLASDDDPLTGPWAQYDAPIAHTLPEPGNVLWTSDYFMFMKWRLNNAASGTEYDTEDPCTITAGMGDLAFYSVWEWKGKIYFTENGPGHIEYSLDNGITWKTDSFMDTNGAFFPAPLRTVLLKAVPDVNAVFLQWGDSYGHVTGNNPDASVTVTGTDPGDEKYATAWFWEDDDVYTLTVDENGGNVNVKVGTMPAFDYDGIPVNVPMGSEVILTASHATDAFSYWEGTVNSADNPLIIGSFDEDHTEKAVFTDDGRDLTVSTAGGPGSVTITIGSGPAAVSFVLVESSDGSPATKTITLPLGATGTLTASTAMPSHFSVWSSSTSSLSGFDPTVNFNLTGDQSATAVFTDGVDDRIMALTATGAGTITMVLDGLYTVEGITSTPPGGIWISDGAEVELTAVPAGVTSGFSHWESTVSDAPASFDPLSDNNTFYMDDDYDLDAVFFTGTGYTLDLNVSPAGGGTIVLTVGGIERTITSSLSHEFAPGTEVTIAYIAAPTYTFTYWSGDRPGVYDFLTFLMDDDYSFTANFTNNGRTLTVSTDGGPGSVTITINTDTTPVSFVLAESTDGTPATKTMTLPRYATGTLTASTALPSHFSLWSSSTASLTGFSPTVSFSLNNNQSATAVFTDGIADVTLTLSVTGT
ncbi:MAG: InlB B-repeat-containing protein, partial [Methanomassiliicoccaceae archaeon]|nr:InlB B-repeat-containing protein [Methanomassiliicoccaceae archaeon]